MQDNVDKLFEIMQAKGAASDRGKFRKVFLTPGNKGYKIRKDIYDGLRADGIIDSPTYEDFRRKLRLGGTPTVNKYRQQMFSSVDPNKSRASELTHRAVGQAVRATNNVRKPVTAKVVNRKGKPTREEFAITPAKTVEDLDREYAQEATKNWENELHNQIADADKDAAKISEMFKSFIGSTDEVGSVWGNMTRGGGIAGTPHSVTTNNGILENTEARQILAAGDYNRKRRELLQLEQDSRNGAIFDNHSFFRGMYDAAKDTGFLTGGASDLINAGSLLATKQDLDNGVHTKAGDMLMQQAVKNSNAQSQYGDNQGWMYTGGVITTNMAPFMVQIGSAGFSKGISNAIGKVVQGAASKVALGTMEKATGMAGAHIANYIGKVTGLTTKAFGKAIQYGIVGAAQANTVGLGNVANDVINRYTGQVYQDEQGNYKFGTFDSDGNLVHEGGEDFLTAFVKGDAAQTIEFATELAGGGIDAAGTALKNFVTNGGKKIINKYNMENVSKVIDFLLNNKVAKNARYLKAGADRTLGKVEVNSIVGESLEEELGIIANMVFTGDNKISDLWDEKQQSQIWGGMLLSIGLMKGVVAPFHAYNAKQYYSYKHKLNKADVNLSQLLGKEKWEELRNQIDATTNENMPEMVNKINRDVALGKNRQPVREYIQNLLIMRGYDIGNMLAAKKAVEDKGEGVSVKNMEKNQAYQQGRDAYGYDTHEIQLDQEDKQKSLAQLLGISEQQLASMSDEELESFSGRDDNIDRAIYDYQLSSARYEGVVDNARDQIDLEVQRAAQAVDMYTDKSRNTIRNATIKASGGLEDYGVYIISGNIATHDDGSIDVSNSDDMILYYDPTTNTVEHADAMMFAELGSEENADEVRSQAMADAKEKAIKETTGIIDGVVEVGTQFKTVDADGTEHTYEVLADNGDGTAMITIDGNVPTEIVKGENVQVPVSFEELQKMKDESDQQRLQVAKAQREQMEKERSEQQMQAQTTQAENPAQENNIQSAPIEDNLDYSDIIREDGKVQMVDVSDKDGNNLFPDAKDVFYIQGNKMRTKFAYIDANGELKTQNFPTGLVKIKTRGEVSVDDYKKYRNMILSAESSAMPETSMIEDNSGSIEADRGGIEVEDNTQPLSEADADNVIAQMESSAETAPDLELTPDNWTAEFGEDGILSTPIGDVKMGENQVAKLFEKGRSKEFGMIKPTLTNPDVIIEVPSHSADGNEERSSSYLFIKTFLGKNGEKVYYFKSVTIKKDGLEISISSHYDRAKRVKEALMKGKLLYRKNDGAQTEQNQPSTSVTTSQEDAAGSSGSKDTNISVNDNENNESLTFEDGTPIPVDENGETDLSQTDAAHAAEWYDNNLGEDADDWLDGEIKKAKKVLEQAKNKKLAGTKPSELVASKKEKEAAIADAQAHYDSAISIRDSLKERRITKEENTAEGRKNLIEKARRKFARLKSAVNNDAEAVAQLYKETVGTLLHRLYDGTGIDVTDTIPLTAEEYVASNLGAHSLNYEGTETSKGVKQETGLSREDFAKTQLLAADGKGTTIDALVHSLWENRPSNLDSLDTQDIRNAMLSVITSGFKASEAKNYIENLRIAQAEKFKEEEKKAADNAAFAEENKAESEQQTETATESEEKTGEENSDEINDKENEKINEQTNENINAPEVPEDATEENPLGLQLSEDKVPFEIEGGKSGETYNINDDEDRQRLINDNKVDDKDILDIDMPKHVHKAIKELCKKMGLKVQFLYMGARSNGWIENGTMYLALDTEKATQFVFGHEMTHAIKQKNPEAYKELVKVAMAVTTRKKFEEDLAKVYQNYHGISGYNNVDDYVEEVVADNLGKFINDFDLAQKFSLRLNHPVLATILHAIQKIKSLLYGDFYKSVDALERIVEKAYVDTAKGEVTNSETGEDVSFSLRQKPEPKKKGVGYKVFVLKNGKLYPPMVANPNGAATPVGVWLDADAAPIAGESKTGRPQVKQGGKGTQGGSGKLAYRPGWHLGVVPYAIQFNRKDADGNKTLFPKNFVFAEVEYAADVDYQEEARQEGINPSGKYQHSLAGLKHLPTDGYYMYRTNPNPDTDPWVITGAMKVNRILTRAEQAELVKNAGREPQQIQEGDIVTDDVVNSINQEIADAPKFSLKPKSVRFEAGKKLSDEEKKEVLSTLKDAYKVNGVPYHIEETAGGKEKRVYEPTADSYVVSDITNRPLRYYITLPDGRVAHPTEVYPNISDNEVKSSATKQGLLDEEVDQIVSAAIGNMKDIADNAKAIEVLTELQNLPHETHDVGYGMNNAQSYNYKTGIFTSDAAQAIDYVVRRMRRKEDVPAEIPAALKKAVADSYGMVDNLIDGMSSTKFSLKKDGMRSLLDVDGKPVVVREENGNVDLNYRTWQDEKELVRDALVTDAGLEEEEADAMIAQADVVADAMKSYMDKYPRFRDYQYAPAGNREIIRDNGEYLSWDYSFNCIKKDAMNAVMDKLVSLGKSSHLGVTQVEAIKKILQKHKFLTPCVMCYVEGKRKVLKQSKMDMQKWNSVREYAGLENKEMGEPTELTDEQQTALKNLSNGKAHIDGIDDYSVQKIANLMLDNDILRGNLNYEWMMSPSSFTQMYNKFGNTGLMEYMTVGQYRGKQLLEATPFSINNIPRELYLKMYSALELKERGGLRQFSYEDARAMMFFDYYTQFLLMQGARSPEHLYTKRPFMPEMFGKTGAMINQSLIVDVWGGDKWHQDALGLSDSEYDSWLRENAGFIPRGALSADNSNYKEGSTELVPAWSVESFPVDKAIENVHNRDFKGYVGNTVVAPSHKFIQWALDNPEIHMILAYHAIGSSPIMKSLTGYDKATAMDDGYHTLGTDGKAIKNIEDKVTGVEISGGALQWNRLLRKNGYDAKKAAQTYLDFCKENGFTPMFNYEGVVDHPNYYKMLTDFRVYDEDGKSIRQKGVKAILPDNWQEILNKYLEQEQTSSEQVSKVTLDENIMKEIDAATKFASIESEERDSIMSLLQKIYGRGNVEVLGQNEFDASLDSATSDGRAQMLRDMGGMVYGYAAGNRIVLNEYVFNANTPLHEHAHLYMKVLSAFNPRLYQRGMDLWRDTPQWNDAKRDIERLGEEPTDERVFSECMAQFTGTANEDIISKVTGITDKNWIQKALEWMKEMWNGVKSAFKRWTKGDLDALTSDDFAHLPLRAFYDTEERNAYIKNVKALNDAGGFDGSIRFSLKAEKEKIVADAKANGTYMIAPNGEKTKLDAEQWATVRTTNFKNWFGDWENDPENASKVVDENGEPMVMYHYTDESFTIFGKDKEVGKNTFGNATNASYAATTTIGHWFTSNKKQPEYMGKPMECFLNIVEPFDGYNLEGLADYLNNYISDEDFNSYEEDYENVAPIIEAGNNFREAQIRDGYDGVVIDDEEFGGTSYVAFNANQIKSAENNNGDFSADNNDIRFSLAGERGAAAADKAEERTFRMDNLSVAKDMEKNKKKAKAIKAATGWERGADGKWRYEMPDVVLRDPKEWVNKKTLTLSDIVEKPNDLFKEYPELFDAYPELKDMKILKGRARSGGVFYNNAITLNLGDIREAIKYDMDTHYKLANNSLKKTLVHEIQHYIQDKEGFAQGGNSEMIIDKNALDAIAKLRAEKDAVAKEFYAMSPEEQQRRKYEINNRYNDLTKQIERLEKSSRIGYDGYNRLSGEVEARNVSARLNMTPEERRKSLAESTEDVARKDQIFLGVGDVSFSLRDMADGKESGAADMAEDLKSLNTPDEVDDAIKTAIDDMPSGWQMANKKMIHIAQALGENRKAEIAGEEPKFSLKDGTLIKAGTYFSGGGLVEEGLKGIIDPVVAVEYDEKISGVYRNNFGQHIVTADVRDVDPKELVKQIDGEVEYFHASPVCKNYSQAKSNHAEVELDKETAASTAEFINAVKPKVVTIENVKGYKDSEAMKIITDALDANGYTWDADVYNAADYGGYTNRERLIVRAVRDGKLPAKPEKMARKSGWYEAVADIIPTLTEKKNGVAPWMDIRLKADGIDWRNIDKPLYVMGSAYADGKVPHAFADELLPTLRTKSGDVIVMPDGKVYRSMGRVLARVSGVSDDYKMPFSENLSHTIIGNGIPTQLTEHVIAPLLQNTLRPTTPEDGNTKFSLRGSTPYDKQMEEWMEKNHLEKGAVPMEKPIMKEGENIFDYANRMVEWTRNQNLWKTAPKQTGFQDALDKWKADNGLSPDAYPPVRPHRENYSTEIGYAEDLEEYNKKKELWKSAPKPKDFDLSVDLEDMNKQLRNIRRAVLNQKNYDQRTVKAVSDLVRKMLNIGWGDGLSRGKVGNLLSAAKNATGANDVKKYLDKAMGILADNYLNRLSTAYDNLINTKGARADQSGVIKMGSLDANGQAFMIEYKKAINMDDSSLNTYIANIEEDSAKNEDNVEMNDYRLAGIQAAIMYKQQIGGNDADISELKRQIGELKNKKDATKEDKDLLKSLEKKLFENKFDRITMYENLLNNIQRMVKESKGRAKEFREEIAEHKNEILHRANLDLEGVDSTYYDTTTAKKKLVNNDLQRAVFSSTYTFEQFLKFFGKKAANGEGYLYNYFTKLNQDALDEEQLYNEMNRNALDEKTKELFGKNKFMKLVGIDGKGMKEMDVEVTDYSNKETGKRTIHLKQGQMLYIYLVNKETDGEMKLRAMGITEEDVAAIEENLDPRVKAMGEWLQDEYLPECQRRYQATHTKYFGAPMKEVENYFPLAINNRARNVKEDVNQDSDAMSQLAGTSTGAIVTRRVNVIPLDIENADAFEVAFNHLQEMEEWSAMLPFRQDINTLLSYTHFRNQVQNMSSVAYGSGKTLWDEFKQTAQIAAGTYKPKVNAGMMDSRIAAAMGGIAVAKISGRLWTAIKQSQSATVFLPECDFTRFVKNGVNPYGSWKWAMENIPDFRKRVENMTYGDVKLRQYLDELEKWHDWTKTISKIGMAPNILVDGITCAVGARSVYETEVNRLTKLGYPKEKAEEKAYYKAVAAYNKTQQSSGGMYLSPMQVDRTYASAALSLFKNANYAYGRMQIEACRGLARTYDFWGGKHKTTLIESMTRQIMEEDGLDENTARAIAKATYNRTFRQSIGRLINFATLVPISWALYKVLPYLLTGDDDDKKKDMIEEAVLKGFATSLSDNYVIPFASNILNAGLKVEDGKPTFDPEVFRYQNLYINPATSDLANIYSMVGNQKWYSVANKLGMLGVQSLIGFNPETVGALYQAFSEADYDNGNTAKEWQIGILKAISAPEESIRELYMDELGLKSGDKDAMKKFMSLAGLDADDINKVPLAELEKRYAERQINRDNLLSQIGMDAETFNGYVDKYQKSFEKKIKDKMDKWDEYDKKKADEFFDTTSDHKLKDMIEKKRAKDANAAADEQIAKEGLNQEKKGKEPSEEAYDAVKMSIDVAEDNAISTYNKVLNKRYASLNDEYNNQTDAMKYIFMSKHPNFKAYKDLESEYTTYGKKMKELKEKLVSADGYDAKQTILKQIRAEREKFSELQSKVR